jgi:enoyl-CoA hydratase/carnithine racemase
MSYEHILVDKEDGVGIVTLNRPEVLNAMNRRLMTELADALKALDADDGVGCLVITGSGDRAFSAGGDIHEQRSDDKKYTPEQLDAMSDPRRSWEIAATRKPSIGMMNGLAYGGAAVLSSSLDMRIGSTWSLPAQVGWPVAKELLFTARVVEAEEAYRIGLLNHLVPRAELRAKTMEVAKMIAANHRGAVMGVKALLLRQSGESYESAWAIEKDYTTNVMRGAKAEDAFPDFIARKGRG